MSNIITLQNNLETLIGTKTIQSTQLPDYLIQNLNPKFTIRDYQKSAFQYFMNYWNNKKDAQIKTKSPNHLMFNMATGSGKTLIMAGLILYLYHQGYRKFLFFVNSDSIIRKTKENFLNPNSSKFLFKNNQFYLNNQLVKIKTVDNFESANDQDIHIVFSTIQGLHSRLNNPCENAITFEDLKAHQMVMISDEAHHINTTTKKKRTTKINDELEFDEDNLTWEDTVVEIFKSNKKNVMLEFTATLDFAIQSVVNKYKDKIIYQYDLRSFSENKYAKNIKILQADLEPMDRALYAVILSQYRRSVFARHYIDAKPVIMMKSETIAKSKANYKAFIELIQTLNVERLELIREKTQHNLIQQILTNYDLNNFLHEIQEDFKQDYLIEVNSKEDSQEKQLALNSLEDRNNPYRVVFAVDKLNEGWDVLNLFDIVKLYDTKIQQNAKNVNLTTISEAQLIGRGARYFPFELKNEINQLDNLEYKFKRKFDDDLTHELAIGEDLYFHSSYNPPYVQELTAILEEQGLLVNSMIEKTIEIKPEIYKKDFYKNSYIYINEQRKPDRQEFKALPIAIREWYFQYQLNTGFSTQYQVFTGLNLYDTNDAELRSKVYQIQDFSINLLKKAINEISLLNFDFLKRMYPHLTSMLEFMTSELYLANIKIEVSGYKEQVQSLSVITPRIQINILKSCLEQIASWIDKEQFNFEGSKIFKPHLIRDIFHNKKLKLKEKTTLQSKDMSHCEWFAYKQAIGTSEEINFLDHFQKNIDAFKAKYHEIYMFRNERFFKLYDFKSGRAFEPDFVLFLVNQESKQESNFYQIFIEPKGEHLSERDQWKEDFLKELESTQGLNDLNIRINQQECNYKILGMPFYKSKSIHEFNKTFNKII